MKPYLERVKLLQKAIIGTAVHAARIVHKVGVYFKRNRERTPLHERKLHQLFIASAIITAHVTIFRDVFPWAFFSAASGIFALVRITLFRNNSVVLRVLSSNQIRETAVASLAVA